MLVYKVNEHWYCQKVKLILHDKIPPAHHYLDEIRTNSSTFPTSYQIS